MDEKSSSNEKTTHKDFESESVKNFKIFVVSIFDKLLPDL